MTNYCNPNQFVLDEFCQQLIRPEPSLIDTLLSNENQVAGHAGFLTTLENPNHCLKPFNIKCVRGRREHLFYQLMEYFRRDMSKNLLDVLQGETEEKHNDGSSKLYYKYFTLLSHPSPPTKCNCVIDEDVMRSLTPFVAKFYHVKQLTRYIPCEGTSPSHLSKENDYLQSVYSDSLICPCYGRDAKQKLLCARNYNRINLLCLEDLTAHCQKPCIIDIKIGQITYDPMAIKEKVMEESSKYQQLREFGFRILGMKRVNEMKDKSFGKGLETSSQIKNALDSFFEPLQVDHLKLAAVSRILRRLRALMNWFVSKNINQLRFFSSSILIVYDSQIDLGLKSDHARHKCIEDSIRVNMIDFAHVFHVHDPMIDIENCEILDNNYIFGLKRLIEFLTVLESQYS